MPEGAGASTSVDAHPSGTGLAQRPATPGIAAHGRPPTYLPEPVSGDNSVAGTPVGQGAAGGKSDGENRFICHICLNSPDKPVVTVCGHLYW